jgi:hypothetical protein
MLLCLQNSSLNKLHSLASRPSALICTCHLNRLPNPVYLVRVACQHPDTPSEMRRRWRSLVSQTSPYPTIPSHHDSQIGQQIKNQKKCVCGGGEGMRERQTYDVLNPIYVLLQYGARRLNALRLDDEQAPIELVRSGRISHRSTDLYHITTPSHGSTERDSFRAGKKGKFQAIKD